MDGALRKVELADIQYVEGMRDYVMIHVASSARPIVTHMTMKAAEELLPAQTFMRIHRSFIVALPHITSFSPTGDLKVGDALLHVSDAFRPAFDAYLKDHSRV